MILSWNAKRGNVGAIAVWAWRGFTLMSPALLVLWLAWTLADLTGSGRSAPGLGTSIYLASLLQDVLSPVWLPTLVFILASLVAYCTGTSWGTMSILIPLVIPLACKILGGGEGSVARTDFFSHRGWSSRRIDFWRPLLSTLRYDYSFESREWVRPYGACLDPGSLRGAGGWDIDSLRYDSHRFWNSDLDCFTGSHPLSLVGTPVSFPRPLRSLNREIAHL